MAHHQGMSLVALDNVLNDSCMQNRFHADPLVQATELLLQERIPMGVPAAHPRSEEVLTGRVARSLDRTGESRLRHCRSTDAAHADPFKRQLQRDAHDGRSRLLVCGPIRSDPLARRSNARQLGHFHLPA